MSRKNTNTNEAEDRTLQSMNLVGKDTVIEGEIRTKGDLRIDGKINGEINSNGKVIVGVSGSIKGALNCRNAEILGTIEGNVSIEELINLRSTSVIEGDIFTNKLAIENGAIFNGRCSMGNSKKEPDNETKGQ
ncbi:MAG: polymer-forming cytoskeletal protein [Lentimicrobiaceae bacterium]|nr:polymer-forming cytoskeletal protein [Lentimicrobiaceae bacterium]